MDYALQNETFLLTGLLFLLGLFLQLPIDLLFALAQGRQEVLRIRVEMLRQRIHGIQQLVEVYIEGIFREQLAGGIVAAAELT